MLHPFHRSVRKRQRSNPKFYFFDLGVKRSLENTLSLPLQENTYAYGKAFEHFLLLEIFRLNSYLEKDYRLSYLRTKDNAEIDLILEGPGQKLTLIEIKTSRQVDERHIKNLQAFQKDLQPKPQAYCLSQDPVPKQIGEVKLFPWQQGLEEIFGFAD